MWSYFTWRCFSLSTRVVRVCAIIIIVSDVLFPYTLSLSISFSLKITTRIRVFVNVLLQCTPFTNIKWIHCCGVRISTNGKFSSRSPSNVYIPLRESYKCSYRSRSRLSSFVEICKHHWRYCRTSWKHGDYIENDFRTVLWVWLGYVNLCINN